MPPTAIRNVAVRRFLIGLALVAGGAAGAAAAPIAVHGRVEGEGGGAVRDAVVRLYPMIGMRGAGELQLAGTFPPPHKVEVKVDAEGAFRLEAPGPGVWRLVASAPGRAPLETVLQPLVEETWLPTAALPADAPIEVTVVDAAGKPAVGATVAAYAAASGRLFDDWYPTTTRLLTDAQGRATVHRSAKSRLDLSVAAARYVVAERKGLAGGNVRIALEKGTARELLVVGADGRPAAGALVMAIPAFAPLVTSDAAGRVAVTTVPGRPLSLVVEDAKGGNATLTVEPPPKGETPRPVRVQLSRSLSMTGRVIDRESRQPLAGAVVWAFGRPESWAVTDGGGGYTVERFPAKGGERGVYGAAAAHRPGFVDVKGSLTSGRAPTMALPPAAAITGSVVDARGRALAGVAVSTVPAIGFGGRVRFTRGMSVGRQGVDTRTDARGAYRLSPLDTDHAYEVTFRKPGFATLTKTVPPATRDRLAELHVTLLAGSRGVGRVVTGQGAPIAGAKVTLERQEERGGPMGRVRRFGVRQEKPPEAATDEKGKFAIADLSAGRFTLRAEASGYAATTVPGIEVPAGAGEVDLGTVKLAPGATVEGRVVGPKGEPLEGAEVFVLDGMSSMMPQVRWALGGLDVQATSAADGFFSVGGRAAGEKVDLAVRRSGYTVERAAGVVAPTAEPVVVTLQPASSVRGRVVDDQGEPIAQASVQLNVERAGGGFAFAMMAGNGRSGDDGRFTIEDVEPGTVRVVADAPGYLTLERGGVEVPAGKDVEGLELVLRAGAFVEGTVSTPDGSPAIGAAVQLVDEGGTGPMTMRMPTLTETDGDGRYRLDGVPTGRQTIQAEHQGFDRGVGELEVRAGENHLDLRLGGGQEVSGRVVGPLGQPVGGATVSLAPPGEFWRGDRSATSDSAGAFNIPGVSDGTYELKATHLDYGDGKAAAPIAVAGAPVAGLTVELPAGATVSGALRGLSLAELSRTGVTAFQEGGGWKQGTVSYDGRYRIAGLAPGEWTIAARLDAGGKQARGRITLAAGAAEETLDLDFEGGVALSGQVRENGRGVDGAVVMVRGNDVAGGGTARTDYSGRYRLENLKRGSYRVEAFAPKSGLRDNGTVTLDDADGELDFDLRATRIVGRVLEAGTGDPIAGAQVRAQPVDPGPAEFMPFDAPVTTDDSGRFVLGTAADGSWRIGAEKSGYARAETTVTATGEPIENLEIRLQPTQGITLQVSRATGAAPAQVMVSVLQGNTHLSTGQYTTGENGRVRLSTVPPGTWQLLVRGDDTSTERVVATSPGPPVSVMLMPQATLNVVVPELVGEAVVATVTLTGGDGQPFAFPAWRSVEDDVPLSYGRTTIRYLPAGSWTVRATTRDGRRWEGTVVTVPGATTTVELR